MKDLPESVGRGAYAIRNWEDIRRGGGVAPKLSDIVSALEGDDRTMMTRQEVLDTIISYFKDKIQIVQDEDTGEPIPIWKSAPTKSQLAARLGISMQTLNRYCKGQYLGGREFQGYKHERIAPEDFDILRRAMLVISDFYEAKLGENRNNSGVIFWLLNSQNDRWTNEQKLEIAESIPGRTPTSSKEELLEIDSISGPAADF